MQSVGIPVSITAGTLSLRQISPFAACAEPCQLAAAQLKTIATAKNGCDIWILVGPPCRFSSKQLETKSA